MLHQHTFFSPFRQLQENVIESHCAGKFTQNRFNTHLQYMQYFTVMFICMCVCEGVGAPLSVERTRMLLVLRINVLAKGHSGVSMETLDAMIKAFNGIPLFYLTLSSPFFSLKYQFFEGV